MSRCWRRDDNKREQKEGETIQHEAAHMKGLKLFPRHSFTADGWFGTMRGAYVRTVLTNWLRSPEAVYRDRLLVAACRPLQCIHSQRP